MGGAAARKGISHLACDSLVEDEDMHISLIILPSGCGMWTYIWIVRAALELISAVCDWLKSTARRPQLELPALPPLQS